MKNILDIFLIFHHLGPTVYIMVKPQCTKASRRNLYLENKIVKLSTSNVKQIEVTHWISIIWHIYGRCREIYRCYYKLCQVSHIFESGAIHLSSLPLMMMPIWMLQQCHVLLHYRLLLFMQLYTVITTYTVMCILSTVYNTHGYIKLV